MGGGDLLSPDLVKVKDTHLVDTPPTVGTGDVGLGLQNIILGRLELVFRNMSAKRRLINLFISRPASLRLRLTWIIAQSNCITGDVLETLLTEGVLVREQTGSRISKGKKIF